MIKRQIHDKILELSAKFQVITITGPRQSGKTTLVKMCFPQYDYVNLESPETRQFAKTDPKSFLENYRKGLIIDEAQYVPELFSYIQTIVDEKQSVGEYILTGSQNFLLTERITQSLAGRVAIFKLLPFSLDELASKYTINNSYEFHVVKGMYPRLWDKDISPSDYYPFYTQTYIERDVRNIKNISDLNLFTKFMQLAAGRAGLIINYSSLATDTGVDVKTIQNWFSILEASYITFFLPSYHKNYNKRLVKSPKLYFYDTGIICSLLGIQNPDILKIHPFKGNIFENFIISELQKYIYNKRLPHNLYYWRDSTGNEIDCIIDLKISQKIVEIKSSRTLHTDFFKNLHYFKKLSGHNNDRLFLIYGDTNKMKQNEVNVLPWNELSNVIDELK